MKNGVLAVISSETILQSKLSVTVMEDCVVIPSFSGQPHTVLSLNCISAVKTVKIYHPGLIVVSAGLFLLSAAALSSKDGGGTGVPIGVLGAVFLVAYIASQKARVVFMIGSEATQTATGSFNDAADLIIAVELAKRNLASLSSETLTRPTVFTRIRRFASGLVSPRVRTSPL